MCLHCGAVWCRRPRALPTRSIDRRVVILRSVAPEPGKWFEEKINLYEDYKQFFNAEPSKVQGIALMSSSDSTNSVAGSDYDDFVLLL
jgi:hypothetical protein